MKYLLIIFALLCVGCGHEIHKGNVILKTHEPARTYHYTWIQWVGKIPITHHATGYDDEDFILTIRGLDDDKDVIEDFYVSKSVYECMREGQLFNDSIPCSTEDGN
jgi:hypothetical protein